MQVPPMPSLLISYMIFQILLSWIAVGLVTRLSTWIPRLPLNVTDLSGEHSQTFNSTDFNGMRSFNSPDFYGKKCTQLSPLKYKNSTLIQETENLQIRLYKNEASSSDAISSDFLYDLPDLVINSSMSYTLWSYWLKNFLESHGCHQMWQEQWTFSNF